MMNTKKDFAKKNIENVAIVQNIKNLIYEKNLTLASGMALCGYKTSHSMFSKWENQNEPIPMESLVKIAAGLSVNLFSIASPTYFGITADYPDKTDISSDNRYTQKEQTLLVEENNMLKDYIRLLKKEKSDLLKQLNKTEDEY